MVDRNVVMDVLRTIDDPEMPISIVDLGMIGDIRIANVPDNEPLASVAVDLLPTFVGCFALPAIETEIRRKLAALPDVASVEVTFRYDPPWNPDRISESGREALRQHGVTVPGGKMRCPFCESENVRIDSPFGPTRCRMIYYCEHCRHSFEHMKHVEHSAPLLQLGEGDEREEPANLN